MSRYKKRKEFSKEQIDKAVELANAGCVIKTICDSINISPAIYYYLKKEYKKNPRTYHFSKSELEFLEKVTEALNRCFILLQGKAFELCLMDGKQALEMLSRRMPREYGRKDFMKQDIKIKKEKEYTDDELDKMIKEKLNQLDAVKE